MIKLLNLLPVFQNSYFSTPVEVKGVGGGWGGEIVTPKRLEMIILSDNSLKLPNT